MPESPDGSTIGGAPVRASPMRPNPPQILFALGIAAVFALEHFDARLPGLIGVPAALGLLAALVGCRRGYDGRQGFEWSLVALSGIPFSMFFC